LLVLNSDRGLAGAFNSNIVKAARDKALELKAQGKTVKFMLVGRKGRPVINRLFPNHIVAQYDTTGFRELGYDNAREIAEQVMAMYEAGEFDVAHLFFSKFRSALLQEATGQQIIPVAAPVDVPASSGAAVEYEPDEEAILADLLPRNITIQIFKGILENAASEQGASMTAMDNATRNAGDLINKLTIIYNRTRQAAITKELIEIISGAEAL
jgi:F-type H+-transporting ATPase subunit gamma